MKQLLILVCLFSSLHIPSLSQILTDSNLPIIIINTDGGVNIPDDPRVRGDMKIIFKGEGLRNYVSDQNTTSYLNYNGRINIEIRGSASQVLPKKQYGFSTMMSDNITNNNVSLLGMPPDNDWILNGLGFEPSLIRDYVNYNLSRMIGQYASRTTFCEVMINGYYQGLYVLEEKIKQGSERVNVTEMEPKDNAYPKISGGYIIKADKTTGGDHAAWFMSSTNGNNDVTFINEYPKPETITGEQNDYIHSEFIKLSSTTAAGNSSFDKGYPAVIDVPSFVDFMILSEFGANADAYQFSTFFHKDRNGKLRAGPIWDCNLTFGYDLSIWGFDRSKTDKWQFSNGDNEGAKFWRDLFNNNEFRCSLSSRWNQLIQPGQPLNYSTVESLIDDAASTISEAAVRENAKWYTVPNLSNEITKIKNWLTLRIPWITANINASNCPGVVIPPLVITKIMYRPDSTINFPGSSDQEFIEIFNNGSKTINLTGVYFSGTGFVYQFPVNSEIAPNSTKVLAGNSQVFMAKHGFPPSGQFTRNLSNTGEKLVLADGFGNVIDSVTYSNKPPWPYADANGYYIELTDPSLDNSKASSWIASANTVVSVNDIENIAGLKFYPSPVKDKLTIESSGTIQLLELYDFQGRLIRKINVGSEHYNLDMSSDQRGIYLIRVFTRDRNFVRKIVKE
jgi:hypothetical protein